VPEPGDVAVRVPDHARFPMEMELLLFHVFIDALYLLSPRQEGGVLDRT
jgi:hypothetical protein